MKRTIAIFLVMLMLTPLCACEGIVSKNEEGPYYSVEKMFVDDDYRDTDGSPLRIVYIFGTIKANDKNLEVSSKSFKMHIGENTYDSDHYSKVSVYAPNYYYREIIKKVYAEESLKIVTTFKVPAVDLKAGKTIKLENGNVPEIDKKTYATDDILHLHGDKAVCKAADPAGYAEELEKRDPVDSATEQKVQSLLNGYYWSFVEGSLSYKLFFNEPNEFTLDTNIADNTGTYSVQKGFIVLHYQTGKTNEVPYEIKGNDIDLDLEAAFSIY